MDGTWPSRLSLEGAKSALVETYTPRTVMSLHHNLYLVSNFHVGGEQDGDATLAKFMEQLGEALSFF